MRVEEVFEFWRNALSDPRARLDAERRKKITERLKDGYSVDDLKLAVIGCAFSEYHQGNNERHTRYQDIELICRSAKKVDQFRDIAEREATRILAERAQQAERDTPRAPMSDAAREKLDALMASMKGRCKSWELHT